MEHLDSNHHNTLSQNCDFIYPVQRSTHSSCSKQQWHTITSPHIHVSLENFLWATRKDLLVIALSSQRRKSQNPVVICPPSWASWRHRVAKYRAWTQDFDPGDWPGASFFSICDLALPFVVKYRMHTRQGENSRVLDKLYFFLSPHLSPSVYCLFYDITNTVPNYCRFLPSAANTSTLSLWYIMLWSITATDDMRKYQNSPSLNPSESQEMKSKMSNCRKHHVTLQKVKKKECKSKKTGRGWQNTLSWQQPLQPWSHGCCGYLC